MNKITDWIEMHDDQIVKDLRQFEQDLKWYSDHLDQLRLDHPDEWVAIYKGQAVFGKTTDTLLLAMAEVNMPRAHSVMEFITEEDIRWMGLALNALGTLSSAGRASR